MTTGGRRRGLTAVETIVMVGLVGALTLYLMIAVPRGRESARRAACQRNLMQFGTALGLYHELEGQLPTALLGGPSPPAAMLDLLGQADFTGLNDRKTPPPRRVSGPLVGRPVRGFVCPSDPDATAGIHPAPISYRATTGDTADGRNGPFSLDRKVTIPEVEALDGASFTAAFSERFVGTGPPMPGDPANYAVVDGPADRASVPIADGADWRGDAGSSWMEADWRSTLANHASPPGFSPSIIAKDGRSAVVGASSGHPTGFHVLMLDGSVKTYRASVDLGIWKALSTIGEVPE